MHSTIAWLVALTTALSASQAIAQSGSSRWKEIGKTAAENLIYVDPSSVKTANGIITARIRVKFVKPVVTPRGNWVQSRHIAMFDCAKKTVAAKESIYYADEAATKVVQKSTIAIPGYGPAIGGSMTAVALDYFCKK